MLLVFPSNTPTSLWKVDTPLASVQKNKTHFSVFRTKERQLNQDYKNSFKPFKIMVVTVSNYSKHETKDGRGFITLELTGGLEFVLSSATGKQYATVRKCSIPSTFDETVAKSLIGSQLPGAVVRVSCEPYEYVKKSTGEVMVLDYNYAYQASLQSETVGHSKVQDLQIA